MIVIREESGLESETIGTVQIIASANVSVMSNHKCYKERGRVGHETGKRIYLKESLMTNLCDEREKERESWS